MKSRRTHILLVAGLILAPLAQATTLPDPPKPKNDEAVSQHVDTTVVVAAVGIGQGGDGGRAFAGASAGAEAAAEAASSATAGQTQTATGGTASNAGNAQSIAIQHQRSAPSLGQGSLMPSGCGMGANAGGSQPGGAAFLGFSFTTAECYKFLLAQHLTAIGMVDSACDVLMSTKSATAAYKKAGLAKPKCDAPEPVREKASSTTVIPIVVPPGVSTELLNETVKRAFEASQSK